MLEKFLQLINPKQMNFSNHSEHDFIILNKSFQYTYLIMNYYIDRKMNKSNGMTYIPTLIHVAFTSYQKRSLLDISFEQ
jgi:hypothetical protein